MTNTPWFNTFAPILLSYEYNRIQVGGRVEGCLNISEKVWDTSRREGVGYKYCTVE
jgi:hypothetical protein